MSSIVRTGGSNIDRSAELRGLSTDTKPTRANGNDVPHGSTWYNMDDSTKYMYNANNDTWYNIPNGGGGGTGDMQKSVYDPTNTVANAGGIDTYVETEISDVKSEIITEVEGDIAPIANNLINDTVGWTNKNLLPITLDQLKAINTSGTWEDNVYTYRGITITVDIFNNLITGININGANTTGSVVFKLTDNFVYQLLSEDKYYISDGVDTTAIVSGSAYISVERKKGESGESHYLSTNNEERSTKFTVDYSIYDYYFVNIYIPNNSSINNAVFYPMIRRASISDDTYEPYTKTVKDEIFNLNSSVGNLKTRVGLAEGNIQTLNEIKANKSDLGTASTKNSTSVVTDSSDLVESGAVKDALGFGNKNRLPLAEYTFIKNSTRTVVPRIKMPLLKVGDKIKVQLKLKDVSGVATGEENTTFFARVGQFTDYALAQYFDTSDSDTQTIELTCRQNVPSESEQVLYMGIANSATGNPSMTAYEIMVSYNGGAYEPYHASVEDSLADKMSYADNGVLGAKNLLTYNHSSDSNNNVTFTVNADKTVTANRTSTSSSDATFKVLDRNSDNYVLPAGKYLISGCPSGGNDERYKFLVQCTRNGALYSFDTDYGNGVLAEVLEGDILQLVIWVNKSYGASNLVFKPMIRLATDTNPTYQPYAQTNRELTVNKANKSDLGTASTKNSTSVVTQSTDLVESGAVFDTLGFGNKNLAKGVENGTWTTASQTKSNSSNRGRVTDIIAVKSSTDYTVSAKALSGKTIQFILQFYSGLGSGTFISETSWSASPFTFTTPANCKYIAFIFRTSSNDENPQNYVDEVQFELGSTATAYEPYYPSVVDMLRDAEVIEGKNLWHVSLERLKSANSNGSWSGNVYTFRGIQYTIITDSNGYVSDIIATGTASGGTAYVIINHATMNNMVSGEYILSTYQNGYVSYYDGTSHSSNTSIEIDYDTLKLTNIWNITVGVTNGVTVTNQSMSVMLRKATETDATYEPYYVPLKDVVPTKADNSVIGTVENGTTASQAYAVGEHFIKDGQFKEVTQAIASGGAISDSNTVNKPIADCLVKQATFSITTDASKGIGKIYSNTDRIILGIKANESGRVITPYYYYDGNDVGIWIKVIGSTGNAVTSTNITGTYYYID